VILKTVPAILGRVGRDPSPKWAGFDAAKNDEYGLSPAKEPDISVGDGGVAPESFSRG
jgi:hypothetical protein